MSYDKKVIQIGTIAMLVAIVGNFLPVAYLAIFKGLCPSGAQIMQIWGVAAATYGISWVIQPISYYPALGAGGSYIGWISGSVGDMKMPSITMAQKISGYEAGTAEGKCMSTIAVVGSIFTSFSIVTIFTIIGNVVLPLLPALVTFAFTFTLPALFAAIYVQMLPKSAKGSIATFIIALVIYHIVKTTGANTGFATLGAVIGGMISCYFVYNMDHKNDAKA
ncbi:hypothetical protein [Intestinibacter sp.]|uniref:hypothetical protein n=1 Tax=Intestinibacter sp. TaxID=1965304 RepID=UPI002A74F824|nr:hypothetical protein [Intestinibacter sp.]MDY2736042.1 hypothetical protein [Intestinibacter sp.]